MKRGVTIMLGVVAAVTLAVPVIAGGGDPVRGTGSGPKVTLPNGTAVAAPAAVPGATMGTVGLSDTYAYAQSAGTNVITVFAGPYYEYNSSGLPILASLRLPAGATLWQVDVYGYTTGAATQDWSLLDQDGTAGGASNVAYVTTGTGPGVVQGTMTFSGGLTLATGHTWFVDLFSTSSATGYVGAVFQYTLPTLSLVPITPVRVFDSRFSSKLVQGSPRTINVKDAINVSTGAVVTPNAIPQGARAVSFTVTVTGTSAAAGYVAVLPGTSTTVTASTINWTGPGMTLATGGLVSLGTGAAERQVTLVAGGGGAASTDVIVDITGYYK